MTFKLTCHVDADFDKITGRARNRIAAAATAGMREAAQQLKSKGRAAIAAGGFSSKWQNAFHTRVYPSEGDSLTPAIVASHKIGYAGIFEHGGTISGSPLLWLPLPNAPFGRGGNRITPAKFVATIGPLYSMKRTGGPPLLGAVIRATDARSQKAISLSQLRRGRNPGGRGSVRLVPMFIGVPNVNISKKFDLAAVARDVAGEVGDLILKHLERSNG